MEGWTGDGAGLVSERLGFMGSAAVGDIVETRHVVGRKGEALYREQHRLRGTRETKATDANCSRAGSVHADGLGRSRASGGVKYRPQHPMIRRHRGN